MTVIRFPRPPPRVGPTAESVKPDEDPSGSYVAYARGQPLPTAKQRPWIPTEGVIHAGLWWATQVSHIAPLFFLGTSLAAVSQEMARRGWTIEGTGDRPPTVWSTLIGGSAAGKSTAKRWLLRIYDDALQATYQTSLPELHLSVGTTLEGICRRLEPAAEGKPSQFWVPSVSRTCALLTADEFVSVLRNHHWPDALTTIWSGDRYRRTLVGAFDEGRDTTIYNPALSGVFCGTDEGMCSTARIEHIRGGFLVRLVWFHAPRRDRDQLRELVRPRDRQAVIDHWSAWMKRLDMLEHALDVSDAARVVRLPNEVKDYLDDRFGERQLRGSDGNSPMAGAYGRLLQMTTTLAGVFAFARFDASTPTVLINADDMTAAMAVMDHSLAYLQKLLPNAQGDASYKQQDRLLTLLDSAGSDGYTPMELSTLTGISARDLDSMLRSLREAEAIIVAPHRRTGKKGRPPIKVWLRQHTPEECLQRTRHLSAVTDQS